MVTLIIFAVVFFLFTLESRCTMLNSYPCTRSWPRRGWAGRAPSCVSASSPRVPCLTTRRPASCGAFCCPCDTRERDQKRRWDREAKAARPRLDSDAFTSKSSKLRATYRQRFGTRRGRLSHFPSVSCSVPTPAGADAHAPCTLTHTHPRSRPGAVYTAPDGRKFTASGAVVPPNECCGFPCLGPDA